MRTPDHWGIKVDREECYIRGSQCRRQPKISWDAGDKSKNSVGLRANLVHSPPTKTTPTRLFSDSRCKMRPLRYPGWSSEGPEVAEPNRTVTSRYTRLFLNQSRKRPRIPQDPKLLYQREWQTWSKALEKSRYSASLSRLCPVLHLGSNVRQKRIHIRSESSRVKPYWALDMVLFSRGNPLERTSLSYTLAVVG